MSLNPAAADQRFVARHIHSPVGRILPDSGTERKAEIDVAGTNHKQGRELFQNPSLVAVLVLDGIHAQFSHEGLHLGGITGRFDLPERLGQFALSAPHRHPDGPGVGLVHYPNQPLGGRGVVAFAHLLLIALPVLHDFAERVGRGKFFGMLQHVGIHLGISVQLFVD